MDMSGISSIYSDYLTSQATSSKTSSLQSKLENTSSSESDDELLEACKEFESYFIEQVYNEMLETITIDEIEAASTAVASEDDED
jgi:flagellar protein FlgJ